MPALTVAVGRGLPSPRLTDEAFDPAPRASSPSTPCECHEFALRFRVEGLSALIRSVPYGTLIVATDRRHAIHVDDRLRRYAERVGLSVSVQESDLETNDPLAFVSDARPPFDLVIVTRDLHRPLFPRITIRDSPASYGGWRIRRPR